jgi:hypothetical protein
MTRPSKLIAIAGICLVPALLAEARPARAETPPPTTFWSFLAIPQTLKQLQTGLNRSGNLPRLEPKPLLKPIADKANLEKMPNGAEKPKAIKTAAEIKQQEDLKKQKIKGLKYLAKIGCGCYPGVAEAIMEAMDPAKECTEEVRYQAVQAVIDAADEPCAGCGQNGCCSEDLIKKMAELAYLKDTHGCWKEPSDRVREALQEALCLCCPGGVPITIQAGEGPKPQPKPEPPAQPAPDEKKPTTQSRVGQAFGQPAEPDAPRFVRDVALRQEEHAKQLSEGSRAPEMLLGSLGHGHVVSFDPANQTVVVECPDAEQARVGSLVTLRRQFLTTNELIGSAEVLHTHHGEIVARVRRMRQPPKRGDAATLLVPAQSMPSPASSFRIPIKSAPAPVAETAKPATFRVSDEPFAVPTAETPEPQVLPDLHSPAEASPADAIALPVSNQATEVSPSDTIAPPDPNQAAEVSSSQATAPPGIAKNEESTDTTVKTATVKPLGKRQTFAVTITKR